MPDKHWKEQEMNPLLFAFTKIPEWLIEDTHVSKN